MAAIIVTIIQILLEIIHNDNVLSSIYSNVKSSWKDRQEKSGTMIRIWKHHSWSINLGSNGIFWGVLAWKHKKSQRKKNQENSVHSWKSWGLSLQIWKKSLGLKAKLDDILDKEITRKK